MKPLFFGEANRRLYGVYHPPAKPSRHAVLLCYPGMQEYNAAHWMFRRLATSLSREGHHVLRFDYYGTGDSDGETDAALVVDGYATVTPLLGIVAAPLKGASDMVENARRRGSSSHAR